MDPKEDQTRGTNSGAGFGQARSGTMQGPGASRVMCVWWSWWGEAPELPKPDSKAKDVFKPTARKASAQAEQPTQRVRPSRRVDQTCNGPSHVGKRWDQRLGNRGA